MSQDSSIPFSPARQAFCGPASNVCAVQEWAEWMSGQLGLIVRHRCFADWKGLDIEPCTNVRPWSD